MTSIDRIAHRCAHSQSRPRSIAWGLTFTAVALLAAIVTIDVFGAEPVAWGYYLIPCAVPVPNWIIYWSYRRRLQQIRRDFYTTYVNTQS